MKTMTIQFPIDDGYGNFSMSPEFRNDEALEFFDDGHVESNGGRVEHHEITPEILAALPVESRVRVEKFLRGV